MRLGTKVVQGLIGGASGAGCMTALRFLARRSGWIDVTPPQLTREWLVDRVGLDPEHPGARQLLDSVVHLAVGVGGGAVYGGLSHRLPPTLASGALFGLGIWSLAFGVLTPWLGITSSPRRGKWRETGVNVVAHLVYGLATALVAQELGRQTHGPDLRLRMLRGRVG
jgi:hypothetical protein